MLASALVLGLLWISGSDRGIPPRRLAGMLLRLAGMLGAGVGGLLIARWQVGGAVFDLDTHRALALAARPLAPGQWVWLAAAVAWIGTWGYLAVRLARRITGPT